MKPLAFLGTSLDDLRAFPESARRCAGFELRLVQRDVEPTDWKPMKQVGPGVREIRIKVGGAFRKTPGPALDLARQRLKLIGD